MANPTNMGASNTNPSNPAAPGGSEGTGNQPSAAQPPARVAIAAFMVGLGPLVTALDASMQAIDPVDSPHRTKVSARQLQVVSLASAMMRTYPELSGVSADTVDNGTADAEACSGLARFLGTLMASVTSTGRLVQENNWHVVSGAIATARKLAPRDAGIAKDMQGINAVLANGSRTLQAGHVAATAQEKAAKATARAAKANAKAAAATARATALQHGTGGAVITQPAPTAPAPSTTAR